MSEAAVAKTKKTKAERRKFSIKRHYFAFPYLFLCVVFVVVPLIILFVYAFRDEHGKFTLGNFALFFTKGVYIQLGNSLLVALVTTVVCLAIAYPVALALAKSKLNKSMILVLLFILPMYINSLLRTLALRYVFDLMGITDTFTRIVGAHVYDFFPFMMLPLYTVLVNMDNSYLEASNDLGGNAFRTFMKVTLPLSVPGVISGIMMVFMPTVSMFAIRDIVTHDTRWPMFGNVISGAFGSTENTFGPGAAYAFILLVIVMVTMVIAGRLNARNSKKTA